ncbi:MAG: hypothetical protein JWO14_2251 [Solirubrobacterales bacterium]|nr:hypothetical protein [Solirubrobacterales bacterium]
MKGIRSRLTYANVVSTLALFLVGAGGTAFAAGQLAKNSVGTAQIKNKAITTAKIKNGAVTGAKINLSTLGTVPSAGTATSAGTADSANTARTAAHADTAGSATSAGHADTANSATLAGHAESADTANTAADAGALGGAPPQSFMRSDRLAFGTASTDPSTPQTVLSIGGIEVTTVGSEPSAFHVRIVNQNLDQWEFSSTAEIGIGSIGQGQETVLGPPTAGPEGAVSARSMVIDGLDREEPNKAIVIECGSDFSPDLLDCFAQLSPAA